MMNLYPTLRSEPKPPQVQGHDKQPIRLQSYRQSHLILVLFHIHHYALLLDRLKNLTSPGQSHH